MNIGKAIMLCRNQKGITKTKLAQDADISISYLTLLEQSKREPNLSTINNICKALQIPPSVLIFLASDSSEQEGISIELAEKLSHLALSLMEKKTECPTYPHKPIGSLNVLAKVLGLDISQLQFLTEHSNEYFFIAKTEKKSDGSLRVTYDVKPKLKSIHRKIAEELLKKVSYPEYLQGSLPKRDYLQNANKHTDSKCIITEDIKNFFPSIKKDIVISIWKNIFHFPEDVSELLSELVTYKGSLVQGCVVSSYIANLVLWRTEPELVLNLSKKGFLYTRYVDDISISSKRPFTTEEKTAIIKNIHTMLKSIGVKLNRRKHEIMPRNSRQKIHRINVNSSQATMPKKERDKVEAAVHQCEQQYKNYFATDEYKKLFNSTLGRVNTLSRLHEKQGILLKERLDKVRPKN